MRMIRVLLVSHSAIGDRGHHRPILYEALSGHPAFLVVGAAAGPASLGANVKRSQEQAGELGLDFYPSLEDALGSGQCDALYMSGPFADRLPVIELAAMHRIAVLSDQPLAESLSQHDAITSVARKAGILLVPAHHLSFVETTTNALDRVKSGLVGLPTVMHVDSVSTDDTAAWPSGGILSFALNPLDIVFRFLGTQVDTVFALAGSDPLVNQASDHAEDMAVVCLAFRNGPTATVTVGRSSLTPPPWGVFGDVQCRLQGTEGSVHWNGLGPALGLRGESEPFTSIPYTADSRERFLTRFARSLENPSLAQPSLEESRSALAVLLASRESIESTMAVSLKDNDSRRS